MYSGIITSVEASTSERRARQAKNSPDHRFPVPCPGLMGTHDTLEDGKIRDQAGGKRCGGRQSLPIISEMFAFQREIECGLEIFEHKYFYKTDWETRSLGSVFFPLRK